MARQPITTTEMFWLDGWGEVPGIEETLDNSASSTQSISESISETVSNSATSTQTLVEFVAEVPLSNSASSTQLIDSADFEFINNRGPPSPESTQTLVEEGIFVENAVNTASSTQSLLESTVNPPLQNIGDGLPSISEAVSESISSSQTNTPSISVADSEGISNSGNSSHNFSEATADTLSSSASSTQTIDEEIFFGVLDTLDNVGNSTQTIVEDFIYPPLHNMGSGSQSILESTIESIVVEATSNQSLLETIADNLQNSAQSTQTVSEIEYVDTLSSTASSTLTIIEEITGTPAPRDDTGVGTQTQIYSGGRFVPIAKPESEQEEITCVGINEQSLLEEIERVIVEQLDPITNTVFSQASPKIVEVEKEVVREIVVEIPGRDAEVIVIDNTTDIEGVIKKALLAERVRYEEQLLLIFNSKLRGNGR